jgi:1-deoxy-D-xylulose-5-phosphate synthase
VAAEINKDFDILKLNQIFPIVLPEDICGYHGIYVFEESMKSGGIGEHIAAKLLSAGFRSKFGITAVEGFVPQASVQSQLKKYSLDSTGVKKTMDEFMIDNIDNANTAYVKIKKAKKK